MSHRLKIQKSWWPSLAWCVRSTSRAIGHVASSHASVDDPWPTPRQVAPEVMQAAAALRAERSDLSASAVCVLQVTSADLLHNDWTDQLKGGAHVETLSHVENLLHSVPQTATIVTVQDAHPAVLSWVGGVFGHRARSLGVNQFGQSGDLPALYEYYGLSTRKIVQVCRDVL